MTKTINEIASIIKNVELFDVRCENVVSENWVKVWDDEYSHIMSVNEIIGVLKACEMYPGQPSFFWNLSFDCKGWVGLIS